MIQWRITALLNPVYDTGSSCKDLAIQTGSAYAASSNITAATTCYHNSYFYPLARLTCYGAIQQP